MINRHEALSLHDSLEEEDGLVDVLDTTIAVGRYIDIDKDGRASTKYRRGRVARILNSGLNILPPFGKLSFANYCSYID